MTCNPLWLAWMRVKRPMLEQLEPLREADDEPKVLA